MSAEQLVADIERAIKRHRFESEMTMAEAVGCLEFVKQSMLVEAFKDDVECCNDECWWSGAESECKMLGAIGPLCPECGETVE